jgi:glycosyltransferase involved in cell wall biosynthesis
MLGTLSIEKGQADAISAVGGARAAGIPLCLDLYGDAEPGELEALEHRIASTGLSGAVRYRGVTTTPLEVLRSADMSLVCSGNEAYGRVTVESLSVGTPVLGYRTGGTAEILADGGGWVVDPSVSAMTQAMIELATNETRFEELQREANDRRDSRTGFGDAEATVRHVDAVVGHAKSSSAV